MSCIPTIGLEIHVELKTKTKMFCGCLNEPDTAEPNTHICPVCLAHPGALPTINKKAVEHVVRLGLALHGTIAAYTNFDRKSYFYPDLPKGFQISQYEDPLVRGGELKHVRIRRIHLEEDTGRLVHVQGGPSTGSGQQASLVDFNRAGVPLMELVTEPCIRNGHTAMEFAKELQRVLRTLGISNADMEKGEMRIEANISVAPEGVSKLGTKVEVKNLNSFKIVGDAIDHEIKRQTALLENSRAVAPETRGWDERAKETIPQRTKEEAHDYRYFPEPDLPALDLSDKKLFDLEALRRMIPELPEARRVRLVREYGITEKQAEILAEDGARNAFFEAAASELGTETKGEHYVLLCNYLTSDLFGLMKERKISFDELKITPENFADLVSLIIKGELTSRMAKDVLFEMLESGEDPRAIMDAKGMKVVSDDAALSQALSDVIAESPKAIADYKKGNANALQFIVGKTMGKLKGQGAPDRIKSLAEELLRKITS